MTIFDNDIKESVKAILMSRNAISANPEHYLFKIFLCNMPPTPLQGLKKFFRIDFPPPPNKESYTAITRKVKLS